MINDWAQEMHNGQLDEAAHHDTTSNLSA
jgi:hypothetical protein